MVFFKVLLPFLFFYCFFLFLFTIILLTKRKTDLLSPPSIDECKKLHQEDSIQFWDTFGMYMYHYKH